MGDNNEMVTSSRRRVGPRQRKKMRRQKIGRLILAILLVIVLLFMGFKYGLKKKTTQTETTATNNTQVEENDTTATAEPTENEGNQAANVDMSLIKYTNDRTELLANLTEFAKGNEHANTIIEKVDSISHKMLALAGNDFDAIEFVYGFITGERTASGEGESHALGRKFPLYLQWDKRWGYEPYGDAGGNVGIYGCGPTTMSMLLDGFAVEGDTTPVAMARAAMEGGYVHDNGTEWRFFEEIPVKFGLKVETIPTVEAFIKTAVKEGAAVIVNVGPGDFTFGGHYLLIIGEDAEGNFILQDSNSVAKSLRTWSFAQLKDQIRAVWKIYK